MTSDQCWSPRKRGKLTIAFEQIVESHAQYINLRRYTLPLPSHVLENILYNAPTPFFSDLSPEHPFSDAQSTKYIMGELNHVRQPDGHSTIRERLCCSSCPPIIRRPRAAERQRLFYDLYTRALSQNRGLWITFPLRSSSKYLASPSPMQSPPFCVRRDKYRESAEPLLYDSIILKGPEALRVC